MRVLLFFSRIALICNVCYVFSVIARYFSVEQLPAFLVSTLVVLGFFAIFLNIIASFLWLVSVVIRKKIIPVSLGIVNLIFLIAQIFNSFYLQL